MNGLDLVVALAGVAVTVLVVAGMILLTPRGIQAPDDETDPDRASPSPARAHGEPVRVPTTP
jgi:hypothetical protein